MNLSTQEWLNEQHKQASYLLKGLPKDTAVNPRINFGWQCPLCNDVFAPFIKKCENNHGYKNYAPNAFGPINTDNRETTGTMVNIPCPDNKPGCLVLHQKPSHD